MKTIKQIADEIGVSKQAVFKKIKQEPLSTSLQSLISTVGNTVHISVDGEKLIKSVFSKDTSSISSTKTVDDSVDEINDSVDDLSTKFIASLQEQIKTLSEQNQDLREQSRNLQNALEREREHSRQQAERLAELSDKLAELTRNSQVLLKQEQDKTAFLLPDESQGGSESNTDGEKVKRGFWRFWKK